ncbi:molybdopterin-guanine dinucleotide biosynthesis protein MobB [Alicyclobacillus cycloheptanicus]|jgi:molybdopterin-guanine dinucleotide biosynthesis protein B|uniref:Molybdopterin-guanine dinucleotide biosynthesis protein B n=1 Tax=Alicyclobacillus cycloheptanicus TaxID=1457 RepID=A0ABT9XIC6_9BACL|nr:molybdopterin-guanine dinucleotide biosynthesis protein MobB [Alicyclobacillus cycloheptanicus]MDQ0190050.1 molybdopterin-guanine dinucleotide biosynthesis protein B [Alicyclobacillus cycloheptanicus]WDM02033.1 molybdopterin-guanine dinucleotide biosynthesis protein MobB [Alicyclobacillus cycloheptanicus]
MTETAREGMRNGAREGMRKPGEPVREGAVRPPICCCIVGRQDAGKTTLLQGLVAHWAARGLRVAVLKHDGHVDAAVQAGHALGVPAAPVDDWEKPGSDTVRYAQSGAAATLVAGGGQSLLRMVRHPGTQNLDDLARGMLAWMTQVGDAPDVLAAEGWKKSDWPKVAVVRRPADVDWLQSEHLANLRAVYCGERLDDALQRVAALGRRVYHGAELTELADDILGWSASD